eukprot:scaffold26932_cov22-Tisochrysis_lutea.AAC.3
MDGHFNSYPLHKSRYLVDGSGRPATLVFTNLLRGELSRGRDLPVPFFSSPRFPLVEEESAAGSDAAMASAPGDRSASHREGGLAWRVALGCKPSRPLRASCNRICSTH